MKLRWSPRRKVLETHSINQKGKRRREEKEENSPTMCYTPKGGPTPIAKRGISEFGNSFSSPSGAQAWRRKRRKRRKFPRKSPS